jgi:hypothetical protein
MDQYETVWLNAKVLFVNFLVEDCNLLLKKLIGVAELIWENIKYLIIPMPADASVDNYTFYA